MSSCVRAVQPAHAALTLETTEHEIATVTGAHAAFEQLYRETADRVYGLCLRMTGDSRRAAEIAQEVFVRVWRGHRRRWPEPRTGTSRAHESVWRLAVRISLGAGHGAAGDLAPRAHAAFVLHDVEGCADPVVAELLGVPSAEARTLLASARAHLLSRRATGVVRGVDDGSPRDEAPSRDGRHLDDRALGDVVDGLLDERASGAARDHLSRCARCRARHDELRSLIARARAARAAVTVPPDLWTVVSAATVYAPMVRRHVIGSPRLAFVTGGVLLALAGAAVMALLLR